MKNKPYILFSLLSFITLLHAKNILSLDLEDLSQIETVDTSATLTETNIKNIPSKVIEITQKDIKESGARNLDELLEIYVPDVAYMYKVEGSQLGMGGIISDRNNKILLFVNGCLLNIKARDGGAITERWFATLGDIRSIKVISGPSSSIYGPGAIAGIISIETFNATSFQGFESTLKLGTGENFQTIELKYGQNLNPDVGLFVYAGIDHDTGADEKHAKNKVAFDYQTNYVNIQADKNIPFPTTNINASYNDELRGKFHFQLSGEHFEFWSRYTKSGIGIPTSQQLYVTAGDYTKLQNTGAKNEQWSNFLSYRQKVFYNTSVEYSIDYTYSNIVNTNSHLDGIKNKNWNENNLHAKTVLHYTQDNSLKHAIGIEYTYTHFKDNNSFAFLTTDPNLNINHFFTTSYAIFGETQYKYNQNFITYFDLRIDKHRLTDFMFSPRAAAVYHLDDTNSLKFSYSRSVRHSDDFDLYKNYLQNKARDIEKLDRLEFIYTNQTDRSEFNFKSVYNIHDVVAYSDVTIPGETKNIGKVKFYTLELDWQYKTGKYFFYFSHNYTKLIDFQPSDSSLQRQNISASYLGYGNDLANWNNHITKIRCNYTHSKKLKFINSLRVFWGIPGAIDMANYNEDNFALEKGTYYRLPVYTQSTQAFKESLYFDSSIEYKYSKSLQLSLYGYNLLGIFNENLNKRNYFQRTSHYILEAPSLMLMLDYKLN